MATRRRRSNRKKVPQQSKRRNYTVSFTISPEMVPRLKRYERHLRDLDPNVSISRAGLLRSLVQRGLVDFELEEDGTKSTTGSKPVVHW